MKSSLSGKWLGPEKPAGAADILRKTNPRSLGASSLTPSSATADSGPVGRLGMTAQGGPRERGAAARLRLKPELRAPLFHRGGAANRVRSALFITSVLTLALLGGCSSPAPKPEAESKPPQPEVKPPKYETGRVAMQRLSVAAKGWAADVQPFGLESVYTKGAPAKEGKAGVWRAEFASLQRRAAKPYVWSGVDEEGAPERGVSAGPDDDFNPRNPSTQPFDAAFLKTDTDKAFTVAQEHGGKKILDKAPDTAITYRLGWDPRKNELVWHVRYGTSPADAKLTVAVNASTGVFLRVLK